MGQEILDKITNKYPLNFTAPGTQIGFNMSLMENPNLNPTYGSVAIDGTSWKTDEPYDRFFPGPLAKLPEFNTSGPDIQLYMS